MLALRVDFLTGRYVATAYNDRQQAEWPPHPARLFAALVAAHADEPRADEAAALDSLAVLGPPELIASDAAQRDVVSVFVPVNDTTLLPDVDKERAQVEVERSALARAHLEKVRAKARK